MPITRSSKYLPSDGSKPDKAKFFCQTCKMWFASHCGRTGHLKNNPDHVVESFATHRTWTGKPQRNNSISASTSTDNDISASLFDYIVDKVQAKINQEIRTICESIKLNRVQSQSKGMSRKSKVYVAR
jgi:hypothetical protein